MLVLLKRGESYRPNLKSNHFTNIENILLKVMAWYLQLNYLWNTVPQKLSRNILHTQEYYLGGLKVN